MNSPWSWSSLVERPKAQALQPKAPLGFHSEQDRARSRRFAQLEQQARRFAGLEATASSTGDTTASPPPVSLGSDGSWANRRRSPHAGAPGGIILQALQVCLCFLEKIAQFGDAGLRLLPEQAPGSIRGYVFPLLKFGRAGLSSFPR